MRIPRELDCRVIVTSPIQALNRVFEGRSFLEATKKMLEDIPSNPALMPKVDFIAMQRIRNKWERANEKAQDYVNNKLYDHWGIHTEDRV